MNDYMNFLLKKLPDNIQVSRCGGHWTASTQDGRAVHAMADTIEDALLNLAIKLCVVDE